MWRNLSRAIFIFLWQEKSEQTVTQSPDNLLLKRRGRASEFLSDAWIRWFVGWRNHKQCQLALYFLKQNRYFYNSVIGLFGPAGASGWIWRFFWKWNANAKWVQLFNHKFTNCQALSLSTLSLYSLSLSLSLIERERELTL